MKRARAYCISDFGKCKSGFLTRVRIVDEEDGRGRGRQKLVFSRRGRMGKPEEEEEEK